MLMLFQNRDSAAGACREALMQSKYVLAYAPNSLYKQPCHRRQLQGPLASTVMYSEPSGSHAVSAINHIPSC